jgi:flagellar hook protein FlgE
MASFSIPLTGLKADSTALNTVANDLSNMNTTAFKAQSTNFSDLFYQEVGTNGAGDLIQVGAGVKVASNETDFTSGTPTSTDVASNVALQGSGFFVVDDGNTQFLTRDGDFQTDSTGNLITTNGENVMGYPAANGVVNTAAPLAGINIPIGQVQQPQATSTLGMTANLDSSATVGTSYPAQVKIYDSLGNAYEATVNFTKTATNTWSYNITLPDTLPAANSAGSAAAVLNVGSTPSTATTVTAPLTATSGAAAFVGTLTPSSSTNALAGTTTYTWNFGANGGSATAVNNNTNLVLGGPALVIPAGGESLINLQTQINAVAGYAASINGNTLSITATTAAANAMNTASTVKGNLTGTSDVYTFNTGGTVNANSTLTISGQTADGTPTSIQAPTITSGESLTAYANQLNTAIGNAGITNVTVTPSAGNNTLTIQGSNLATSNSLSEDLPANTTVYNFNPSATVDPSTNFTITGQTATGASATITPPQITANMSIGAYVTALQTAINNAGGVGIPLVGVSVSAQDGQVTLTGANMSVANNMVQDVTATKSTYTFGSSGGVSTTVDPSSNLTITGLTGTGSTATITPPAITADESVASYAKALQDAVNNAGIGGVTVSGANGVVTITGANLTTAGTVVQDAVASANASGVMTFDSSGNLASPAANISGINFGGLSDGAAALGMTWDILGAGGTPTIGQVDTASAVSGTSQNGYATGQYESFAVGSDGTVTVTYNNGQQQNVGQIALANVANLQGLTMLGNGDYGVTQASGAAAIGISGSAGLGTMEGGALEASNVNISTEFSELIVAQRAFEANAKSVTTFDTVTQDTINMVH